MIFQRLGKDIILFLIGGGLYNIIEIIFKATFGGQTHWSMFVLGGILFLSIGSIEEIIPRKMPLLLQGIIGAVLITAVELAAGLYLNVYLGLGIWDYSGFRFNLWGQICPQFFAAWLLLAIFGVILNDWLRFWMFQEERPDFD